MSSEVYLGEVDCRRIEALTCAVEQLTAALMGRANGVVRKCKSCEFYVADELIATDENGYLTGECRRFPPTLQNTDSAVEDSINPAYERDASMNMNACNSICVKEDHWCGEWSQSTPVWARCRGAQGRD